ncbi:MAG: excinuclease ABC subunit UvrA [Verrucomicrobiaceae bacterium]|nr:excinuclease ABC subunit UvrA [Verrucomicrobiaceae bacterium]
MDFIRVRGARQHNLKNIDVDIPRHQLVVLTGVSGSGKSSLAFDTLYAEGQRRYVQSLSAYARQFLDQMEKPDVDFIEGLSPAVAIEQINATPNPRSTIATVTEIYDYLRVLYAVAGQPHDPKTGEKLVRSTPAEIGEKILALGEGTRLVVLSPQPAAKADTLKPFFEKLRRQGFIRVRLDGQIIELDTDPPLSKSEKHQLDIVIDRLVVRPDARPRLMEAIEAALHWNEREVQFLAETRGETLEVRSEKSSSAATSDLSPLTSNLLSFTTAYTNPKTGYSLEKLTPQHFSFNTHLGACPACEGVGSILRPDPTLIVPDESKSLAEGAIKSWWAKIPKLKIIFNRGIEALAKHYNIDSKAPFSSLPAAFKHALFHGTGEIAIDTGWQKSSNKKSLAKPFEGLLAEIARLHRNAESEMLKANLTRLMAPHPCAACEGKRLRKESLAVYLSSQFSVPSSQLPEPTENREPRTANIHDFTSLDIASALNWMRELDVTAQQQAYVGELQREILKRLEFLEQVGLGYLALNRQSGTLSGGEMQRIRLATQIGAGLSGVLYVLDEPSIGLHPTDNERLIRTLHRLRDLGNSVLVVEHDEAMMRAADHLIELGPAAGVHGGHLIAQGSVAEVIANADSLTGQFLSGKRRIEASLKLEVRSEKSQTPLLTSHLSHLTIHGATAHNLKNLTVRFPLGCFTCVTGPSGSGKSTLVDDILMRALQRHFYNAKEAPAAHERITGLELIDKVVVIDQSPIGRSPRSNPATYCGVFTPIRELFAKLPLARQRGFDAGRFSFNTPGGRCEKCQGDGQIQIDMHFLADVHVTCEACKGRRYGLETLEITFKGKSIADVLDMTVSEAHRFFANDRQIAPKLATLEDCGLGYIKLGQSGAALSGGEAQRVKLSTELAKRSTGKTLYLLDEPTTGLHSADIQTLLDVLLRLRDAGNTLIVIEHHLDVIRNADHVIDLGPTGGPEGGYLLAEGTPEEVARNERSITGRFLNTSITCDVRIVSDFI